MNKLYITLLMALCLCLSAYPQASGAFKYKNDIYYLQNVTVDANNSTGVNVPTLLLIGSNVVNDGFVGPVVLTSTANISASVEINRMAEYWRMLPNVRINQGAKFTLDYYKSFPVGNRSFLSELPVKLAFIGGNAGLKIFSNFTGSKYDYETETPPLYFPDPNQKDNKFGVCAQEMINSESDTVSWLAFGYDKPNSFFNNSLSVDQNGNVFNYHGVNFIYVVVDKFG